MSQAGNGAVSAGGSAILAADNPFYIHASAPLGMEHSRVLKQGETFAVFDAHGDIRKVGLGEEGLFHEGTRFLSLLVLELGPERPLFLSSTVKEDNALLAVDLTNPDIHDGDQVVLPRGTLHLFRAKFLWQGACYERLRVRNYGPAPVRAALSFRFAADFTDIFEVRGTRRERRGRLLAPEVIRDRVVLAYQGLDGVVRRSCLQFEPAPTRLTAADAQYQLELPAQGEATLVVATSCESGDASGPPPLDYEPAFVLASDRLRMTRERAAAVETSNERFNDWLNRSRADLDMMVSETPEGPYPYAGVPWFSTPFGRDGILTALEYLWLNPGLARGVLSFLAATQATDEIPEQDAEPGKILHEMRHGEMAALGEVPFGRYYGSVDSTPLFVLLAAEYFERTADREFIASLWPHVDAALRWIDVYGDRDGDGFVEYYRRTPQGLANQGWKDSHDAVFHADGQLAEGPIALCEVQGYVYAAKRGAAAIASALGQADRATVLQQQAGALRKQFERDFWCEDLSTYALALDRAKRPCRVRTSNPGHCLYTGIVSPERARRVATTLMDDTSFSGWGVRTVATTEARYNPMSYHNGSVWPHDNALIAAGLARYRLAGAAVRILTGLFDASLFVDLHRLPELFCGFLRRPGEGPTLYPVACAPQAWAAGAVFLLLQACLGLSIRANESRVYLEYPLLPESLKEIRIHNLRIGSGTVDLQLQYHHYDVSVNVLDRTGNVEVVAIK